MTSYVYNNSPAGEGNAPQKAYAAAFVLLIPLALTSNAFSIRRLGKVWARIHRLIYITAVCGAIHFALATKVLSGEQYLYLTLIALLLGYRLVRSYLKRARRTDALNLRVAVVAAGARVHRGHEREPRRELRRAARSCD